MKEVIKKIIHIALCLCITLFLCAMTMAYNDQQTIYRCNVKCKDKIALTFDDGPSKAVTPLILDLLKQSKAEEPLVRVLPFSKTLESSLIDSFNRTRAYLKIEDGCSSKCAYCIIPKARGPVRSKPREEVLKEINALLEDSDGEIIELTEEKELEFQLTLLIQDSYRLSLNC